MLCALGREVDIKVTYFMRAAIRMDRAAGELLQRDSSLVVSHNFAMITYTYSHPEPSQARRLNSHYQKNELRKRTKYYKRSLHANRPHPLPFLPTQTRSSHPIPSLAAFLTHSDNPGRHQLLDLER